MILNNFKEVRQELKLTQIDVAIMLKVSRVTYNKWEQDPLIMPFGKLIEVSNKLNKMKEVRDGVDTSK